MLICKKRNGSLAVSSMERLHGRAEYFRDTDRDEKRNIVKGQKNNNVPGENCIQQK